MSAGTVPADIKKSEKGKLVGLVDTVKSAVAAQDLDDTLTELGTGSQILNGEEGLLVACALNVLCRVVAKSRQRGERQTDGAVFGHIAVR